MGVYLALGRESSGRAVAWTFFVCLFGLNYCFFNYFSKFKRIFFFLF